MAASDAKPPRFGERHKQCILLFCCQFVMYTVLLNVPLAIVAMTDSSTANPDFPEFDWNEETRATILSSFFWGYITSQIACGYLATRYGGKIILFIGVAGNSILNLMIPQCTIWGGSTALLILRIVQGAFQGVLFPATHGLLSQWAPIEERSVLSVLVYPGAQIGSIIALSTGGLVAASSLGWPGIFYIWGGCGLIWCLAWSIYGANDPNEHKSITAAERDFIAKAKSTFVNHPATPWKRIMQSGPFYALLITHICGSYAFWTITTITPSYIKGVFAVDIQNNALVSAIPPLGLFIMSQVCGLVTKILTTHLKLPLRVIRIVFNTIGLGVPGFALLALGFVSNDSIVLAVVLLTVAYSGISAVYSGYYVNHMDLCPTHAGLLMGVTNSAATISGIFSTLLVGAVVQNEANPQQWQVIFSIGAGLSTIGVLIFAFFGRFENQNWVEENSKKSVNDEIIRA